MLNLTSFFIREKKSRTRITWTFSTFSYTFFLTKITNKKKPKKWISYSEKLGKKMVLYSSGKYFFPLRKKDIHQHIWWIWWRGLHLKNWISIIIGKNMQMFCFKVQQNHTINEELDIFEEREREGPPGGKGTPIYKMYSQLLLVNIWKCCVSNFIKIAQ